MRVPLSLCAALFCSACATQTYPSTQTSPSTVSMQQPSNYKPKNPPESVQSPPESNCREFTAPVTVGGQQQQAVGQVCEQPDGSWQITQNTPGSPPQVYRLPPQAVYDYPYPYPYYSADPWDFGPPFVAGGSIFFADGFSPFP